MAESWDLWAHARKGSYQHIGDNWWVGIHGFPDPVVPVTVVLVDKDAEDGTHWGWIDTKDRHGDGRPVMIWRFRGAFDAQFPYTPEAEEKRGKGRVVRLRITEREDR